MYRAIVVILALLAPAALAEDGGQAFRDWSAACSPAGYCSATALSRPGGTRPPGSLVLIVARHAQQPYWELSFSTLATPAADQWADVTVAVDGASQTFALPAEVGAYGEDSDIYLLGGGAQAVMDRLAPGTTLTLAYTDIDGAAQEAGFSLTGLTAALLWIDGQQRRIGSERVAAAPPHGLVPLDAGMIAPDLPLALLDRHRADPDCPPLETLANGRDFAAGALGDGLTVYLIPCRAGADTFAHKVYVGSGEGADAWFEPQFFASYGTDIGWTGTPYLWNGGYDETAQSLVGASSARGIGGCGSQGTWQWNGNLFVLTEMRARDCADETRDVDGEMAEFPLVYEGNRSTLR